MSPRAGAVAAASIRHLVLAVTGAFMLAPFVWMLALSIKTPGEIFQTGFSLLPRTFYGIENYRTALTASPLPRFLGNGVIVCGAILALQLVICLPAGYALAKLRFPGRELLFRLVLVALPVPSQVLAIPLFVAAARLGLLNSYFVLIAPFAVSPFGIFLFRQFFRATPDDLIYAARLDGMSELAIVWRVMVPLAAPAIATFAFFSVVTHWNSLFWPLIAVRDQTLMPPALGVIAFSNGEAGAEYGPLMAAATLIVAPLVCAFLAAQRWFIGGLTAGAVK